MLGGDMKNSKAAFQLSGAEHFKAYEQALLSLALLFSIRFRNLYADKKRFVAYYKRRQMKNSLILVCSAVMCLKMRFLTTIAILHSNM